MSDLEKVKAAVEATDWSRIGVQWVLCRCGARTRSKVRHVGELGRAVMWTPCRGCDRQDRVETAAPTWQELTGAASAELLAVSAFHAGPEWGEQAWRWRLKFASDGATLYSTLGYESSDDALVAGDLVAQEFTSHGIPGACPPDPRWVWQRDDVVDPECAANYRRSCLRAAWGKMGMRDPTVQREFYRARLQSLGIRYGSREWQETMGEVHTPPPPPPCEEGGGGRMNRTPGPHWRESATGL